MSAGIQKKHILVALVATVALAIAWYALSPLLRNKVVNDVLPEPARQDGQSKEIPQSIAVGEPDPNKSVAETIPVVATTAHPASGTVRVVKNGDETIIRYENYKTINGPDLRVYLATDLEATKYVDLGKIKGTEGNINYTVPAGTDLSQYRYVLTWCEDFSVLFNSADLSLAR